MEAAGAADKILMDAKAESPGCLKARGPQTMFLCNLCDAIFVVLAEPVQ